MTRSTELPPLATLCPWLDGFAGLRVAVWGDLVADRFLYGSTTRVSREAPALVLQHESEEVRAGGAGNALMNVASLGGEAVALGFLGDDPAGGRLTEVLAVAGVDGSRLLRRADAPTPVKTRIMAGGLHTVRQQVLRIDQDRPWPTTDEWSGRLQQQLEEAVEDADALIISDYGLGTVTPDAWRRLQPLCRDRDLPVVLDSRHALLDYRGVWAATPNEEEVEGALRTRLDGHLARLEQIGADLMRHLACRALLITRGSCGMAVFEQAAAACHLPIHGTDQIADVTGAGDTVIATFTLGLAAGASTFEAARLANVAGGLVVMKRGTATVSGDELRAELEAGE